MTATVRSSYTNQGQICLCGSRILVEEKIYAQFKKDFVQRVSELIVGESISRKYKYWRIGFENTFRKSEILY